MSSVLDRGSASTFLRGADSRTIVRWLRRVELEAVLAGILVRGEDQAARLAGRVEELRALRHRPIEDLSRQLEEERRRSRELADKLIARAVVA